MRTVLARCKFAVSSGFAFFCGHRKRASRNLKNNWQGWFVVLVVCAFASYNKAIKHRSASLHWTAYGGRLLQRYMTMKMNKKFINGYSALLTLGGVYYLVICVLQFESTYLAWQSWANPNKDFDAYAMLIFTYILNVGTPALMLLTGFFLFKNGRVSAYVAFLLAVFLVMAPLIGKLILLLGVLLLIAVKSTAIIKAKA